MKDYDVENLLACPRCKSSLRFYSDKINCDICSSSFSKKDGIYILSDDSLQDYDREQQSVFDKTCRGYDRYLNEQPLYVSIRDKYVLKQWFKEDFYDKVVLDIGCGTGWASGKILSHASVLVNVDISFNNLVYCKERLGTRRAIYVQADMKKLPLVARRFDIVTCFWALHHIQEPRMVVEEIRRVLIKDGIFLGIEPNIRYTWVELLSDLFSLPVSIKRRIIATHKKIQHYTHKRLEKEEFYMNGIQLKYNHHSGLSSLQDYETIFSNSAFKLSYTPVGLEIAPPRFFMLKNKLLVNLLLKLSTYFMRYIKKNKRAMFFIIRATKQTEYS